MHASHMIQNDAGICKVGFERPVIEREQVSKPGGAKNLSACHPLLLAILVLIQTINKAKAAIHLGPITFMKGLMHNLSAHQHESRCKDAENARGFFLPRGNNSPIAAPFAGECQAVTPQVQLICLSHPLWPPARPERW